MSKNVGNWTALASVSIWRSPFPVRQSSHPADPASHFPNESSRERRPSLRDLDIDLVAPFSPCRRYLPRPPPFPPRPRPLGLSSIPSQLDAVTNPVTDHLPPWPSIVPSLASHSLTIRDLQDVPASPARREIAPSGAGSADADETAIVASSLASAIPAPSPTTSPSLSSPPLTTTLISTSQSAHISLSVEPHSSSLSLDQAGGVASGTPNLTASAAVLNKATADDAPKKRERDRPNPLNIISYQRTRIKSERQQAADTETTSRSVLSQYYDEFVN